MRYLEVGLLVLALCPHARGQVLDKCQAAKIKAAGKKTYDKAKCRAKALQKGVAIDPLCLTKAEDKFGQAITKADTLGSCSGTATDLEAAVDQAVNAYATLVNAPVTSTTTTTTISPTTTSTLSIPCGSATYPQCGGECPAGQSCYPVRDPLPGEEATSCSCGPTGVACDASCTAFACPPGKQCLVSSLLCGGCSS